MSFLKKNILMQKSVMTLNSLFYSRFNCTKKLQMIFAENPQAEAIFLELIKELKV